MRALTLAIFFAAILGCNPPVDTSAPPKPAPETSATTVPRPKQLTPDSVSSTTGGQAKSGDVANRLYQLRELKRVILVANSHKVPVWVMDDDSKREEGMMWLTGKNVKDDEGMIFVFPDEQVKELAFWMQNTVLPLDIIFISPAKKVLNVQHGKAFDTTSLPSAGVAKYVLEMKAGSAKRLGIGKGTPVLIPAEVVGK